MLAGVHQVAVDAAREAGRIVRGYFQEATIIQMKGEDNPLTEADLASNRVLYERLLGAYPDFGWLSEETVDDGARLQKREVWIIDPVDGTLEFTKGIPEFVISIGLVIDGAPVLGVLYNPIRDQLFSGIVGQGAWYNGQPTHTSTRAELSGSRVVCSRTEMSKGWFDPYKDLLVPEPVGSVAYKFGLVAAGMAEATFTPRPRHEWDVAGGAAIVLAAGGRFTNGAGDAVVFNQPKPLVDGIAATNGPIHDGILGLMKG